MIISWKWSYWRNIQETCHRSFLINNRRYIQLNYQRKKINIVSVGKNLNIFSLKSSWNFSYTSMNKININRYSNSKNIAEEIIRCVTKGLCKWIRFLRKVFPKGFKCLNLLSKPFQKSIRRNSQRISYNIIYWNFIEISV